MVKDEIMGILNIRVINGIDKYLGVPLALIWSFKEGALDFN